MNNNSIRFLKNDEPLSIIDRIVIHQFNGKYVKDKQGNSHKAGTIEKTLLDYIEETRDPSSIYIERVQTIRAVKRCKTLKEVERLDISIADCKSVKDAYAKAKRQLTKHVYLSCIFDGTGCTSDKVTDTTSLLGYDLQHLTEQQIEALKKDPRIVVFHKSIGGGKGDYALLLWAPGVTVASYKEFWQMGYELLEKDFGITPDKSDKVDDITRIRYRSYDPDIHYNPYAEPVFVSDIIIKTDFTLAQKEKINEYLDEEETWFKFLLALAVVKGEEGRPLAHIFSRENPERYSPETVDKKYTECLNRINKWKDLEK